jgi:hypothetical protein
MQYSQKLQSINCQKFGVPIKLLSKTMQWSKVFPRLTISLLTTSANIFDTDNKLKKSGCPWRNNITEPSALNETGEIVLENCLYYYLVQSQSQSNQLEVFEEPTFVLPLDIQIDRYVILQVDHLPALTPQFAIRGDVYISWNDSRLEWVEREWRLKEIPIREGRHIWTVS